jgi:hypothetical protein
MAALILGSAEDPGVGEFGRGAVRRLGDRR